MYINYPDSLVKTMVKLFAILAILILSSIMWECQRPFVPPYENTAGRVIKIEYCTTDTLCLVVSDIPLPTNKREYTDTLTVNGKLFSGVLQTYDLPIRYQVLGEKVGIDFEVIDNQAKKCSGRPTYEIPMVKLLRVEPKAYNL